MAEQGRSQDLTGVWGGVGVAKIKEEGRVRNLAENLKVTVPCGLEETQSWSGRGSSPGDRNEQCSLSFLPFHSAGEKERKLLLHIHDQEEKGRSGSRKSHRLRTTNQPSPHQKWEWFGGGGRLRFQEASRPIVHHGVSQRHPLTATAPPHTCSETGTLHLALQAQPLSSVPLSEPS